MAVLLIGLLAAGLIMVDMPRPDKYAVYGWHKAFGMIALLLILVRIIWRYYKKPPVAVAMPEPMALASKMTHFALYALMVAMPVLGWTMSSAGGHAVKLFGFEVPALVEKNKELGAWANDMHEYGSYALIALIVLHFVAALYHHFIRKDGLLSRMKPCILQKKDLSE